MLLDYQLVRSKRRKTLGLQVKHGQVFIRAPHFLDEKFISAFFQEHLPWLKKKVCEQQQEKSNHFNFTHGSDLLLFGNKVKLEIQLGRKKNVSLKAHAIEDAHAYLSVTLNERLVINSNEQNSLAGQVKKQLEAFYKIQATNYIIDRVAELSLETSLTPNQIKIRQYRARWGSCNNRGEVSFNYLLAMAPKWVIDYVIIHELCHLKHLNHSTQFWALVAQHSPNYAEAKQWFINNQNGLVWRLPH